jgi:hypothetical protein
LVPDACQPQGDWRLRAFLQPCLQVLQRARLVAKAELHLGQRMRGGHTTHSAVTQQATTTDTSVAALRPRHDASLHTHGNCTRLADGQSLADTEARRARSAALCFGHNAFSQLQHLLTARELLPAGTPAEHMMGIVQVRSQAGALVHRSSAQTRSVSLRTGSPAWKAAALDRHHGRAYRASKNSGCVPPPYVRPGATNRSRAHGCGCDLCHGSMTRLISPLFAPLPQNRERCTRR